MDRNARDKFKGNANWHACAEFCAKYDQNSFDPDYDNMELNEFRDMVQSVFKNPKRSIAMAYQNDTDSS